MSDYSAEMARRRYCEAFLLTTAPTVAVNVAITTSSTAATLASASPALIYGGVYAIAATGIPASTTFVFRGSTAIVLSQAATATNAAAAATISPV
jgi:hypothetical protein